MRQEDKEMLLTDLCARLPYGVKCENFNRVYGKNVFKVTDIRDNGYICGTINNKHCWAVFDQLELKPYLFPLSSMTEEQEIEYDATFETIVYEDGRKDSVMTYKSFDWLNKNYFDYRGLIPMDLAIDCTNLNIY